MKQKLLLSAFLLWCVSAAFAQNENESPRNFGANKFMLTGNGEVKFVSDTTTKNFTELNFKPIFLWKLSDRMFVESEIEIETGGGGPDLGLEYVNMCYMLNPYMIVHAGRFLPKFGAYRGKLGEGFINRFASDPVGWGDGGIGTMDEVGVGILGGVPLGCAKMNYDIWLSDGPQLNSEDGSIDYEAYTDLNKNKAIGGRLGFLPLSNSSLELGFSYETASRINLDFETPKVGVNMMAVDLNYYKSISSLKSTIRVIGEYKKQDSDPFTLAGDTSTTPATYHNSGSCYYGTVSIRPTGSENNFLRNLEVAARMSHFEMKEDSPEAIVGDFIPPTNPGTYKRDKMEFALDYWLKWNSVVKLMYQKEKDKDGQIIAQLVYGF